MAKTKKQIKKGNPRPKASGRSAPTALHLKVGGKYKTRSGHTVTITRKVESQYTVFPFRGRSTRHGGLSWQEDGSYYDENPHDLDLIREVPSPKAKGTRK